MSAILFSLFGIGLAWLLGTLLVLAVWPRLNDRALAIFLGWSVGVGVTSSAFFIATHFSVYPLRFSLPLEIASVALLGWRLRQANSASAKTHEATHEPRAPGLVRKLFWVTAIVALAVASAAWMAEPYGGWDGWALWNMKARFLLLGGTDAMALMAQHPLTWTHPDYPLLLPSSVARAWAFSGSDHALATGLISTLFGVCTVGTLVRVSSRLSCGYVGYVAGIVLLTTPAFVRTSSNEHADVPLGFMMLAALGSLLIARQQKSRGGLVIAGVIAGFAAWTKNEGLLFCVVLTATLVILETRSRRGALLPWFLLGLATPLALVCWFKLTLVPANDILAGQSSGNLGRVIDWSRHEIILRSFARDLAAFGSWSSVLPLIAVFACLVGYLRHSFNESGALLSGVLTLMLAGYYSVYLLSPFDLTWHLDSSLVRLLLQLWPLALLWWAVLFPLKGEARDGRTTPAPSPAD